MPVPEQSLRRRLLTRLWLPLLGVFLLGTLTKRVRENEAIAAMLAGLAMMSWVRFGTSIAWTWYVLIGTTVTFVVGYVASLFHGPAQDRASERAG